MVALKNVRTNWIILALCMSLAALTNHSHGEVVYRKLSAPEVIAAAESCEPSPAPTLAVEEASAGLAVVKIQKKGRSLIALLAGGQRDGLLPGSILQTSRRGIPTALLKTTEVRENYTLAEVTEDGSKDSGVYYPEAPGLMVGDRAEPQEIKISQSLRILPHRTLTYERLFIDPKNLPTTFELSAEGRNFLLEQAQIFMKAHASLLLVEGHTDPKGESQSNQVESYQRAMTVRQVLIDEFGLDPNRVVAIGLGETEPLDEPYLPGRAEEARRIILKVKSQPLPH
ncbi:MAG: OmpA family protein [Pseudobdellovibrionaceae bacterium]|nr:OmpA family protein [Pseudobdellovibrionaceae bacterium]